MNPRSGPLRVAIVGAGCTGLRIATLFKKLAQQRSEFSSLELVVFEATATFGGFLQSKQNAEGVLIESGAQGVLSSRIAFLKTLEDLALTPNDVIAPSRDSKRSRRFVISPLGKITPLPSNPLLLWRSGLLNPLQLMRIFAEFFFIRRPSIPNFNETLLDFFKRHFGKAFAQNLVVPFATGIWGGGAEKLLLRHTFPGLSEMERQSPSLLRLTLFRVLFGRKNQSPEKNTLTHTWPKGLLSFPGGMNVLASKMIEHLKTWQGAFEIRYKTPIHTIAKTSQGEFVLNDEFKFDCVFWTTGPWNTPDLKFENALAQNDWHALQKTPTHNLIVCNISGPRNPNTQDGFGVLAGGASDGLLGVLFTHSIYSEHVPKDHFSYRILLGGDRNPGMVNWTDAQIQNYCLEQLKSLKFIPAQDIPYKTEIVRWRRAVCLADVEHDERLAALWRIEACLPNLHFAGIYKKGIGVADALSSAQEEFDSCLKGWPWCKIP